MKTLTFILLTFLIFGCKHNDTEDSSKTKLSDINLTGTWVAVNETKRFKSETGEYLSSSFFTSKYVMEETEVGVKYESCQDYGGEIPSYGIKAEHRFYVTITDSGFILQEDGSLVQHSTYENDNASGINVESIITLNKVSDDVSIDNGTFVLNGPISNTEYNHVCLWQDDYSIGVDRTIDITVPFDNDTLSLTLYFYVDMIPRTYQYVNTDNESPFRMEIRSRSDTFIAQVGAEAISPTSASITIIESTPGKLSGTYTLVGEDLTNYSGEFEIFYH